MKYHGDKNITQQLRDVHRDDCWDSEGVDDSCSSRWTVTECVGSRVMSRLSCLLLNSISLLWVGQWKWSEMGSPFQLIIYTPDQAQAHILQSCNITQYEQNKMAIYIYIIIKKKLLGIYLTIIYLFKYMLLNYMAHIKPCRLPCWSNFLSLVFNVLYTNLNKLELISTHNRIWH